MRSNRQFFVLLDALRTANATKLYFCGVQKAVARGFEAGWGGVVGWLALRVVQYAQAQSIIRTWRGSAGLVAGGPIKGPGRTAGACEAAQSKTDSPPWGG